MKVSVLSVNKFHGFLSLQPWEPLLRFARIAYFFSYYTSILLNSSNFLSYFIDNLFLISSWRFLQRAFRSIPLALLSVRLIGVSRLQRLYTPQRIRYKSSKKLGTPPPRAASGLPGLLFRPSCIQLAIPFSLSLSISLLGYLLFHRSKYIFIMNNCKQSYK